MKVDVLENSSLPLVGRVGVGVGKSFRIKMISMVSGQSDLYL
jgi:hypothetical protein